VVYVIVAAGAVAISMARPVFQALLPPNLHLFTATFLVGLGLWISGVPFLSRVANWMGFQAAVKAMVAASLIHGLTTGIPWRFSLTPELWLPLAIAVGAGVSLSMMGMVLGLLLNRAADQRPLNMGAGISLTAMGLSILGVNIPSLWVMIPLAVGCLWSAGASAYRAALRQLPHLGTYLDFPAEG